MSQVVFLLLFSVDRDINQGMFVFDFDFWAKFACFICSYGKVINWCFLPRENDVFAYLFSEFYPRPLGSY